MSGTNSSQFNLGQRYDAHKNNSGFCHHVRCKLNAPYKKTNAEMYAIVVEKMGEQAGEWLDKEWKDYSILCEIAHEDKMEADYQKEYGNSICWNDY